MNLLNREMIREFFTRLDAAFGCPARVYLIGETTQAWEGWREWTRQIEFTAETAGEDRAAFSETARRLAQNLEIEILEEHPGDLVPLPEGYQSRAVASKTAFPGRFLQLYHFDPYSVAFRYIARGDETDYHLALMYLQHGWIVEETMDELLASLLPEFSMETIQQDPAEFRRRYKGLKQMLRALRPGVIHRPTPV